MGSYANDGVVVRAGLLGAAAIIPGGAATVYVVGGGNRNSGNDNLPIDTSASRGARNVYVYISNRTPNVSSIPYTLRYVGSSGNFKSALEIAVATVFAEHQPHVIFIPAIKNGDRLNVLHRGNAGELAVQVFGEELQ